jgi:hypothetical protein
MGVTVNVLALVVDAFLVLDLLGEVSVVQIYSREDKS